MTTQYQSIALVDRNYLFKKRYHTIGNATPMAAAKATLADLAELAKDVDHMIICCDAPPYKHRLAIYKDYKANREEPEPEEVAQRRFLRDEIERLGYSVAWVDGYEADDVIATLAKEYGQWCHDVRIVCVDKDAAQCVTSNVKQFIPPVGKSDWVVRDPAAVLDKFGVPPNLMPMYQALCGDTSDNVPGVFGIGEVKAASLVTSYPSVAALAERMAAETAAGAKCPAMWRSLAKQWESGFMLSLRLVMLDTNVPLDFDALLVKHDPLPPAVPHVSNLTAVADPEEGEQMTHEELSTHARTVYDAKFVANDGETAPESTTAAKDDALLEQEYDRERQQNGEHDAVTNDPGQKAAEPVAPTPRKTQAIVRAVPNVSASTQKYGQVDDNLQPMDLLAAITMSEWLFKGGLYQQYENEAQIFTVMARSKDLKVGVTTALGGHHIIKGKPVAHADFIRGLCERDPSFEYLYPTEMSDTRVVWVGKRKNNPKEVPFTYTREDAVRAGLCKLQNYGGASNWDKFPLEMLNKTAGSKLARILWPAAVMGLYCPEELGFSSEEVFKEAA